jgi:LPXTG-motif cell wall-anchored protein
MKFQVRGAVCAAILCVAAVGVAQTNDNSRMPNQGMSQGMTASGAIVSVSDSKIVIRTDAGETKTFNRDVATVGPTNLMAGDRVTVRYNELATDNLLLTSIETGDPAGTSGTVGDRTNTNTPGVAGQTNTTTPGVAGQTNTSTPGVTDRSTTAGTSGTYDRLPQTASPLVMIALAGLVSLGGALVMRARRRV